MAFAPRKSEQSSEDRTYTHRPFAVEGADTGPLIYSYYNFIIRKSGAKGTPQSPVSGKGCSRCLIPSVSWSALAASHPHMQGQCLAGQQWLPRPTSRQDLCLISRKVEESVLEAKLKDPQIQSRASMLKVYNLPFHYIILLWCSEHLHY